MERLINSISIKNYRGFGKNKDQDSHNGMYKLELADRNHITFLVGPNNAGKSIIARLFTILENKFDYVNNYYNIKVENWNDRDFYDFNTAEQVVIKFSINKNPITEFVVGESEELLFLNSNTFNFVIRVIKQNGLDGLNFRGYFFLEIGNDVSHDFSLDDGKVSYKERLDFKHKYYNGDRNLSPLLLTLFHRLQKRILIFDSIRSFNGDQNSKLAVNGSSLLEWLSEGKNHGDIRRAKEKVGKWLYELNMEVPRAVRVDSLESRQLLFTFENHLELSSKEVGTGYTMLYILLMEIARNTKHLILIDEIESHLQPGLIRVLIEIIKNNSDAQLILATHSPTVMDSSTEEDQLYQFKKEDGECKFVGFKRDWSAQTNSSLLLREVTHALGVIPGDAFLSNTVIWVEGPTEVLWMRAWLREYYKIYKKEYEVKENLIEGLHYSILMTGGNLIAHYAFSEDEVDVEEMREEYLLQVLRVNPNPFVIMDSDNPKSGSEKHKRIFRIIGELNKRNMTHPVFRIDVIDENLIETEYKKIPNLWLLEGKELENYAHPSLLKSFYEKKSEHSGSTITGVKECNDWDVFSKTQGPGAILLEGGITGVNKGDALKHKLDLASYVFRNFERVHFEKNTKELDSPNSDMVEDLVNNMKKLIRFIRRSNGMACE